MPLHGTPPPDAADEYAKDLHRRRGSFLICKQTIDHDPELVMAILGSVIVVRAEYSYQQQAIVYDAMGPDFDIVPDGVPGPNYCLEVHAEHTETEIIRTLTWKKVLKHAD